MKHGSKGAACREKKEREQGSFFPLLSVDETVSASSMALGDPFQTSTFHTGNFLLCVSECVWKERQRNKRGERDRRRVTERRWQRHGERKSGTKRSKKNPGVEMFPLWQSDKPVINIAALQRLTPGGLCVVLRGAWQWWEEILALMSHEHEIINSSWRSLQRSSSWQTGSMLLSLAVSQWNGTTLDGMGWFALPLHAGSSQRSALNS